MQGYCGSIVVGLSTQEVSIPIIELCAFRQAGKALVVRSYMAGQLKAGFGDPVGVGVVVGAALEVISIQLPSVKPHWHPRSTGEQSGSASQ